LAEFGDEQQRCAFDELGNAQPAVPIAPGTGNFQHGADARLTNLRTVLAGDCPRIGGAIYEQCGVHYPQLVRLWRGEPPG
jgi:hypothetical protein